MVRIPGTTRPQEIVVLGAHLDSYDITPGAADDAAGVAAVLAVMRELAKNPPPRTVLLVFFADEEVNLSGGLAFAKSHEKEMPNLVAAIEMDDGDGPPRALQVTSSQAETGAALRALRRIAEGVGPEADGLELRADTAGYGADIEPLWNEHGVPEIAILQDLTAFFDRHHAENDLPSAVDMEGFGQTTFLLMRIVQVLASGAVTPPRRTVEAPRSPLP